MAQEHSAAQATVHVILHWQIFGEESGVMTSVICSRCEQQDHIAAVCPHKSFLKTCTFCGQVGHMERTCQERRTQAIARHADWKERQKEAVASRARNAEWFARHAERLANFASPKQNANAD